MFTALLATVLLRISVAGRPDGSTRLNVVASVTGSFQVSNQKKRRSSRISHNHHHQYRHSDVSVAVVSSPPTSLLQQQQNSTEHAHGERDPSESAEGHDHKSHDTTVAIHSHGDLLDDVGDTAASSGHQETGRVVKALRTAMLLQTGSDKASNDNAGQTKSTKASAATSAGDVVAETLVDAPAISGVDETSRMPPMRAESVDAPELTLANKVDSSSAQGTATTNEAEANEADDDMGESSAGSREPSSQLSNVETDAESKTTAEPQAEDPEPFVLAEKKVVVGSDSFGPVIETVNASGGVKEDRSSSLIAKPIEGTFVETSVTPFESETPKKDDEATHEQTHLKATPVVVTDVDADLPTDVVDDDDEDPPEGPANTVSALELRSQQRLSGPDEAAAGNGSNATAVGNGTDAASDAASDGKSASVDAKTKHAMMVSVVSVCLALVFHTLPLH
jgi:hypothetical protein